MGNAAGNTAIGCVKAANDIPPSLNALRFGQVEVLTAISAQCCGAAFQQHGRPIVAINVRESARNCRSQSWSQGALPRRPIEYFVP
jgi:hypothetical protein